MNAKAIARHYGSLTPEERFRLILAAGARRDEAERDRLANASGRITFSVRDFQPYAQAFDELNLLIFIELSDEAAGYFEAFRQAEPSDDFDDLDDDGEEEEEDGETEEEPEAKAELADEADERPLWQRSLDIALAAGFVLRAMSDGWKLFCERLNLPPFWLWEKLPGFDRLQRALTVAEKAAFVPEGMVRWLNRIRPEGKPEVTVESLISAEKYADASEDLFRERVEWWGG
jgi:hypothetical protein